MNIMDTLPRWLEIAFFLALILIGFVLAMWFPIQYSWGRKYKEKLTGMQKLKFSLMVGVGLSIVLSAFFPVVVLILTNPNNADLPSENLRSLLSCVIPLAIIMGSVAAVGTYINFSWLDWPIWRFSKTKKED